LGADPNKIFGYSMAQEIFIKVNFEYARHFVVISAKLFVINIAFKAFLM